MFGQKNKKIINYKLISTYNYLIFINIFNYVCHITLFEPLTQFEVKSFG